MAKARPVLCVGRMFGALAVLVALTSRPRAPSRAVDADSSPILVSTCGAATVNGVISPGEWSDASPYTLPMVSPNGTDLFTVTLRVMNGERNLYLGFTIDDDELTPTGQWLPQGDGFRIDFDNDASGSLFSPEDEVLGCYAGLPQFYDGYLNPAPDSSERSSDDTTSGGTLDGQGAASRVDVQNHFELVHPLCSGDTRDYCLQPGDSVGFRLEYFDCEGDGSFGGSQFYPGHDATSEATLIIGQCPEPMPDRYTYLPLTLR